MLVQIKVLMRDIIVIKLMMHADEMPDGLLLPPLHVLRLWMLLW